MKKNITTSVNSNASQASSAAMVPTVQERALLLAFRAMTDDVRVYALAISKSLTEISSRPRSAVASNTQLNAGCAA